MNEASLSSLGSPLSPAFRRAGLISRLMAIVLTVGLGFTSFLVVALIGILIWPSAGDYRLAGEAGIKLAALPLGPRAIATIGTVVGILPPLLILYHARRVFIHFARGEVFAPSPIRHIRTTGIALIVAPFAYAFEQIVVNYATSIGPIMRLDRLELPFLFFGIGIYVTAYVMGEAQRIADDNASIV